MGRDAAIATSLPHNDQLSTPRFVQAFNIDAAGFREVRSARPRARGERHRTGRRIETCPSAAMWQRGRAHVRTGGRSEGRARLEAREQNRRDWGQHILVGCGAGPSRRFG